MAESSFPQGGYERMKILDRVALVLGIIGALNWGIVGLFRFDCVA